MANLSNQIPETINLLNLNTVSDWQPYVPSSVQGLTITSRLQWRRNGTNLEVTGDFDVSASTASLVRIELPNSYTVEFQSSTDTVSVGHALKDTAATDLFYVLATDGNTYVNLSYHSSVSSINKLDPANGNDLYSGTDRGSIHFSVPVVEFAEAGLTSISENRVGNLGLIKGAKFQTKTLSSDVTTNNFDFLSFNNLVIGQSYNLKGNMYIEFRSDNGMSIVINDAPALAGNYLAELAARDGDGTSVNLSENAGFDLHFTAATTSVFFRTRNFGGTSFVAKDGNEGLGKASYATIIETQGLYETSDFT